MRERHDSQFSDLVTGSCTEIEEGGGRNRLGENTKIYVLDMFNLRCLLDIQVEITREQWVYKLRTSTFRGQQGRMRRHRYVSRRRNWLTDHIRCY